MKRWLKLAGVLLIVSALVIAYVIDCREAERRYEGIRAGMTPEEVEEVMGRPSDGPLEHVGTAYLRKDWDFSCIGNKRTAIVWFRQPAPGVAFQKQLISQRVILANEYLEEW